MRVSTKDQFNLNPSIRGLTLLTMYIYSDIYEYMYYFTLKRLLNQDDDNAELIKGLIVGLKKDLNEIRLLIMKKN